MVKKGNCTNELPCADKPLTPTNSQNPVDIASIYIYLFIYVYIYICICMYRYMYIYKTYGTKKQKKKNDAGYRSPGADPKAHSRLNDSVTL